VLLESVPGVFATNAGLGEGELKMRGFDADKVQILINGIPVNDPESQQVYWSNWTGLSSTVKSVQVQRGAGTSMYGSGAFGGSVNIETIGAGGEPDKMWTFRTSFGTFFDSDKVADGKGDLIDYNPYNYNLLLRYNSGNLYGGKFNYSAMIERKVGDYYTIGTTYDGWSFNAELQNIWGNHKVNTSLIIAPQKHNQTRAMQDMNLEDQLGRAYNRYNHPYQENYYNKPQLSVRDEWQITDKTLLLTNLFFTRGDGGGKYLKNDKFDVETGRNYYMPTDEYTDNKYFSRHAVHIYEQIGVLLQGLTIDDSTGGYLWNGAPFTFGYGSNLPNYDYNHSCMNDSQNNHKQFGFNTYVDHKINDMIKVVVGGEWRHWVGLHRALQRNFRYNGGVYALTQDRYNYYGIVNNASAFARAQVKPLPAVTFMIDGQYAYYSSRVDEEPIAIFDYQRGDFTGDFYYPTKDMMTPLLDEDYDPVVDPQGNVVMVKKFTEEDYERVFKFFSPKFGVNFNVTEYLNIIGNYSIAYKEPRLGDWYSRSGGPGGGQLYEAEFVQSDGDTIMIDQYYDLDSEKATTIEFGGGYTGLWFDISANYYRTKYEDKIENSLTQSDDYVTINAGTAIHQGLEFTANAVVGNFDMGMAGSIGKYRWDEMNVQQIFGEPDSLIVDKVVPFSPERQASFSFGYTFDNMPGDGKLRIGFSGLWWDEYYASYTNKYMSFEGYNPQTGAEIWEEKDAKLPYFFAVSSDISYTFKIAGKDATLRLDLKNINNRKDNYTKADYAADYGRNDPLNGEDYMYVVAAPLFHAFLTAEVNF
ncbi:MAG: TonB-dependent receptor, partial [Candidatus Cloacimonetes bacterium]|nr:TonB-dependent receptor [Candidatus Cloacimonadota bacterium]